MSDPIELALDERDAACAALDEGDPETAKVRCRAALDLLAGRTGGVATEQASVMLVLGEAEEALGDITGARRTLTAALLARSPQDEDPDRLRLWAQIQVRLGDLDRQGGDLAGAEERLRAVADTACEVFGGTDDVVVSAWNALGIVHKYQARFDDAEAAYRRAVTAAEAGAEPDPLTLAALFHNLGGLDHARGRAAAGIVWAEGGLELRERALGGEHPHVAADLAALGALYQLAGRFEDAAVAYRRALAIFEAAPGRTITRWG